MPNSIDIDALSGILGSISIACWVVVFTPQIIENFRRSSAEGLSLLFVIIWLAGDVFNILGAVLQGVLPTMTILAVYYTVADIVLLGQCIWYRGWRFGEKELVKPHGGGDEEAVEEVPVTEETPLLVNDGGETSTRSRPRLLDAGNQKGSQSSVRSSFSNNVDATHLSPTTPFLPPLNPTSTPPAAETLKPHSALWAFLFNISALIIVCLAGVLGWYLSNRAQSGPIHAPSNHQGQHEHDNSDETYARSHFASLPLLPPISSFKPSLAPPPPDHDTLHFDLWGQIFGYLCAVLYLGSRLPQLLLNYRRKSTDGVSLLFFLFACVGNLTYVLSIFAYEPNCARVEGTTPRMGSVSRSDRSHEGCRGGEWNEEYGRYILVNASWLVGSAGTLVLDLCIFAQFWVYRGRPRIAT